MLTVLWHDEESAGFTDHFPDAWFVRDDSVQAREHKVTGPRSGIYKAKCNLFVKGDVAELNYEAHRSFNTSQGMHLGVMRIQFTGADRKTVSLVSWKEEGGKFLPSSTTVGFNYPSADAGSAMLPDEVPPGTIFSEGSVQRILVNRYERDPKARQRCLDAQGTSCCVCGFNFGAVYGEIAEGYVHVHHTRPLSEAQSAHAVDPDADLRPVCPNCHAVLHRRAPVYSIDELREILQQRNASKS